MRPKFWGVIVFLLTVAVAATPASGGDSYLVVTSTEKGQATYMTTNPENGEMSDQQDMALDFSDFSADLPSNAVSYGNGLGYFNDDPYPDYITAIGSFSGAIIIFEGPDFKESTKVAATPLYRYPADIAVAHFNEDKYTDFVLNFRWTGDCAIYLGGEGYTFQEILLPSSTPTPSTGVDVADFDNQNGVDFVVGQGFGTPFRVYLNNGDGTFTEAGGLSTGSISGQFSGFSGIAAGDFIHYPAGEGIVDLVVSGKNRLDIYTGNGDGSFTYHSSYTLPQDLQPMDGSPIDNGDFDNDGIQDIVLGNIGPLRSHDGAAVLLGDGYGYFEAAGDFLSTGGPAGTRAAVTALPYRSNKEPVAVLTPEVINVTVGETVEWDASESFDEDGTIVSYHWDYGDGVEPFTESVNDGGSGEAQSSYVYFDSGFYEVTLTVTDDQGATATVKAKVNVEALGVSVYFSPRKLNLKSKGKWITATIRVPPGYDARGIDADSLWLVVDEQPVVQAHKVYPHRWDRKHHKKKYRRIRKLKAKFDRQALIAALTTGSATLGVSGEIAAGNAMLEFEGKRTITAYEKEKKKSHRGHGWKKAFSFFSKGKSK
jgi:hypothetical protein